MAERNRFNYFPTLCQTLFAASFQLGRRLSTTRTLSAEATRLKSQAQLIEYSLSEIPADAFDLLRSSVLQVSHSNI